MIKLTAEEYMTKMDSLVDCRVYLRSKIIKLQQLIDSNLKKKTSPILKKRRQQEQQIKDDMKSVKLQETRIRKIKILMTRMTEQIETRFDYIPETLTPEQLEIIRNDNNKINIIKNSILI